MSTVTAHAQNLIGDHWLDGSGEEFQRLTPAGDATVCSGFAASLSQVDDAISAARKAFFPWSETSLDARMNIARRFAELVSERKEELARLISTEMGKPLWESRTEAMAVVGKVGNSIDAIMKRRWTTSEQLGDYVAVTRYRPHGVMLVLGPFNLPAHLPGSHMVPALLAGNTIVFKPSELAPTVGQWLVETWQAAGIPTGVINLVHGGAPVAIHAAESRQVDGVLFTGSHKVGLSLHRSMAGQPHRVLVLELGGNNPLVVHQCQDLRRTAFTIINSAYLTSGQRCTCARRLIVVGQSNYDSLMHLLARMLPKVRVSDPFAEPQPFMGPLVHATAAQNMLSAQAEMLAAGAEPIVEMKLSGSHPALLSPGLIAVSSQFSNDSEHFGPLLVAQVASDLDEAIQLASATQFGLSAGFLGDRIEDFHYFLHRVRAGIVNWNRQTTGASGRLPFGGVGASGNHQPSGYFAADYCSYPIGSLESHGISDSEQSTPGLDQIVEPE